MSSWLIRKRSIPQDHLCLLLPHACHHIQLFLLDSFMYIGSFLSHQSLGSQSHHFSLLNAGVLVPMFLYVFFLKWYHFLKGLYSVYCQRYMAEENIKSFYLYSFLLFYHEIFNFAFLNLGTSEYSKNYTWQLNMLCTEAVILS